MIKPSKKVYNLMINLMSLSTAIKIINRHNLMRISIIHSDSEIKSVARNYCRKNKLSPQDAIL